MAATVTPLGYALMGLIRDEARSGYALRKVFETTPMGNYSSSPGSIYPALKALERTGLVEARDATSRGKGLYHLTVQGRAAFADWLRAPVEDLGEAMLRFAFLHDAETSVTLAFLDAFEATARQGVAGLEAFLDSEDGRAMPLQARLAVEHGRRGQMASVDWAVWARKQLERQQLGMPTPENTNNWKKGN